MRKLIFILSTAVGSLLIADPYPEISSAFGDPANQFVQQSVSQYYQAEAGQSEYPELALFQLSVDSAADLFSLSARFNLPAETIASLNGLSTAHAPLPSTLLVPNIPGIFIPGDPVHELERMTLRRLEEVSELRVEIIVIRLGNAVPGVFMIGERYDQRERAVFLRRFFNPPLQEYRISAYFGIGTDPFSSSTRFHQGIDLVPESDNTFVYPTAPGRIAEIGSDSIYGNYIFVIHDREYASLYAHLDEILVSETQEVDRETRIGEIGTTGLSTGPHLHFEIQHNGVAVDPGTYILQFRRGD